MTFTLPAEEEGGAWLLEIDTADPGKAAATPCARRIRGRRRGRWSCCASRWTPKAARAAAGAPGAGDQAAGAAAAAARRASPCRCSRSARRPAGGWARSRTSRSFARLGGARRASRCCSSCPSTRASDVDPSPYAASSAFALDPASTCRWTRARTSSPRAAAARCPTAWRRASTAADRGAAGRLAAPCATLKRRRHRAGVRALPARRVAHAVAARAAPLGVHARQPRRGWTTTRCSPCCTTDQRRGWLDWPRAARAIATRARSPTAAARARRRAAARRSGCSGSSSCSGGAARREASAAGVELMGDLPFVVGLDSADVWANRGAVPPRPAPGHAARRRRRPRARTGGCRSTTGTRWRATASRGSGARASRAGELYSLYRVDHALGCYRTYFALARRQAERLHAARRVGAGPAAARS